MSAFSTMLKKEWMETKRSYKLLIIPIAFSILMLALPISMYLLPSLIESDLPEGTVIQIPESKTVDILPAIFSNFEQTGIIVLIIISMGAIAKERENGSAAMVLSKPISRKSYVLAKWTMYSLIGIFGFLLGMILTIYYTAILFEGPIEIYDIARGTVSYSLLILLCVSVTIFYSSFVKSSIVTGMLSYATYLAITKLSALLPKSIIEISPYSLIDRTNDIMVGINDRIWISVLGMVILIAGFLLAGVYLFKKQEI